MTKTQLLEALETLTENIAVPPVPDAHKLTAAQLKAVLDLHLYARGSMELGFADAIHSVADRYFDSEKVLKLIKICEREFPDEEGVAGLVIPGTIIATIHLIAVLMTCAQGNTQSVVAAVHAVSDILAKIPEPDGMKHN